MADNDYVRGLKDAAEVADGWAQSHSCDRHDTNPCCHVRTGAGIRDAIAALIPADNSVAAKCPHGVLWSMECLSCGPSDFTATVPPDSTEQARQIATEIVDSCYFSNDADDTTGGYDRKSLIQEFAAALDEHDKKVWREAIDVVRNSGKESMKAGLNIVSTEIAIARLERASKEKGNG